MVRDVLIVDDTLPDLYQFLRGINTNVCVIVGNPGEITNINVINDPNMWEDIRRYKCDLHIANDPSENYTVSGWNEYVDGSGRNVIEPIEKIYPKCTCDLYAKAVFTGPIENIGFVWDSKDPLAVPFGGGERIGGVYTSEFIELIRDICGTVDLITCDRFIPHFKTETRRIEEDTGIIIRYSLDKTGNPHNGGDWIMESTGDSIREQWFDDMIQDYHQLLGVMNPDFGNVFMTIDASSFVAGGNNWYNSNAGIGDIGGNIGGFQHISSLQSRVAGFASHSLSFAKMENGDIYASGKYSSIASTPTGTGFGLAGFTDTSVFTKLEPTTIDAHDIVGIRTLGDSTMVLSVSGDLYFSGPPTTFHYGRGFPSDVSATTFVDFTPCPLFNAVIDQKRSLGIDVVSFDILVNHTFIVFSDGSVYGSGLNSNGELGLVNTNSYSYEVVELSVQDVRSVYTIGYLNSVFFLGNDGSVKACGNNEAGNLGIGSISSPITNINTVYNSGVKSVCGTATGSTYFLFENGDVYACGKNRIDGYTLINRLGDGTLNLVSSPIKVSINVSVIHTIDSGVLFVKHNGSIQSFGSYFSDGTEYIIPYQPFTKYSENVIGSMRYWLKRMGGNMSDVGGFGNAETDTYSLVDATRRYPPASMTQDSQMILGQVYGNGLYVATSSGVGSSPDLGPFRLFDNANETFFDSVGWHSTVSYDANTGNYTGGNNINGYGGEWVKIQLPKSVIIREYRIRPRQDTTLVFNSRNPNTFKLFGSNDDTNWVELDHQRDIHYELDQDRTFLLPFNENAYSYYALVINITGTESGNGFRSSVQIKEWFLMEDQMTEPTYMKELSVQGGIGDNITNGYQVFLQLYNNTGADFSLSYYFNRLIRGDFGGIEFYSPDKKQRLNYWFETNTEQSGIETLVWVSIKNDTEENPTNVYIVYGDTRIDPKSSGEDTFDYFDNFEDSGITDAKFPSRNNPDQISVANGELQISTNTSATQYGFSYIDTDGVYNNVLDHSIRLSASLGTNTIGEIVARGNIASNSGYKARFDQRPNEGLSILKPPYSGWGFIDGQERQSLAVGTERVYEFGTFGSSLTMESLGLTKVSRTDTQYSSAGSLGIQNHFGGTLTVYWIAVRKLNSVSPLVDFLDDSLLGEGVQIFLPPVIESRLYIPVNQNLIMNLFEYNNDNIIFAGDLVKNIIKYSFESGGDGGNGYGEIGDNLSLGLFLEDVRTMISYKMANELYPTVESEVFNETNHSNLRYMLEPSIRGRIREVLEMGDIGVNDIILSQTQETIGIQLFSIITPTRVEPLGTVNIKFKMRYSPTINVLVKEGISQTTSGNVLDILNETSLPRNKQSYALNHTGMSISDDFIDLDVGIISVPDGGIVPDFASENLIYYIDPGNPYSNQGDGTFINLGSENVSTNVVGYSDGDTSDSLVLSGSTGSGIQLGSISNIRTISMFCKFPSVYTNKEFLLDTRTGTDGYIWIFGLEAGSPWDNCKMYVNGGRESTLNSSSLVYITDSNDRWRHITLIANTPFTDDITFFNRFTNTQSADVEFGVIKLFDREITEEESRSVFFDHYRHYQDGVDDGLVFYIDPVNPRSYVPNNLYFTNLVDPTTVITLPGTTSDYAYLADDLALELLHSNNSAIEVSSISNLRTLSMWINVRTFSTGSNYVCDARLGDGEGYILEYAPGNQIGSLWLNCTYYLDGKEGTMTSDNLDTVMDNNGEWRHLVMVANRDFTDDITILSRYDNQYNETTLCMMGPVKMFNRPITEAEALSLYNEFGSRYGKEYKASVYSRTYIDDESMLLYDPDRSQTTVIRDLQGDNSGNIQGGVTYDLLSTGRYVYSLNGSTGYISTTTQFTDPDTFSLLAWFNTTDTSAPIIGMEDLQTGAYSTAYDRRISITSTGNITFDIYNAGQNSLVSTNAYNDGLWHLVVATYDKNTQEMKLYIDGNIESKTLSFVSDAAYYSGYWRIGAWRTWEPNGGDYFTGQIGMVGVYSTVLAEEQIVSFYNDTVQEYTG